MLKTVYMIGLLAVILLAVNGKEDGYMCDSIYAEYDSCENQNSIVMKKNYLNPYPLDYNEEEAVARHYNELNLIEEKRNKPVSACDCHMKIDFVPTGPLSFPPFYKNVTCQDRHALPGMRKCMRGFHCSPISYPVKILQKKRNDMVDSNEVNTQMPFSLRKCWTVISLHAVAGCICTPI